MIEDELWIVLGIVLLLVIAILIYLAVTNPKFKEIMINFVRNFKLPTPWKKIGQ